MNIVKATLISLGSILFVWFLIPSVFLGILNSGNGIGMLFSGALILYGFFITRINNFIANKWHSVYGRFVLVIVGFVAAMAIVFVVVFTIKIVCAVHNPAECETTVVVLGCQIHPLGPSMMLEERLEAAYEYLEENKNLKCVLSGGQGEDEVMSEAECMYNWLVEKGIDGGRLYIEDKSTSTRENLAFSRELIEKNGLSPKITIITNDFHQYRAGMIAEAIGIESYSVSGKTFKTILPTYYVRELGGILYEIFVEN